MACTLSADVWISPLHTVNPKYSIILNNLDFSLETRMPASLRLYKTHSICFTWSSLFREKIITSST